MRTRTLRRSRIAGDLVAGDERHAFHGLAVATLQATQQPGEIAGSILPDMPLPSGTLSVNGSSTWTRNTNTYSLTVSTNPDLHFNATCTVRPKFDSGTVHATVVRNGATSNVTIQFTACGQFTVTRT